jgi:hypothetical protein
MKTTKNSQPFFLLLFPITLWVTNTYIVLNFHKPWECNHEKTETQHFPLRHGSLYPNAAANMFAPTQGATEAIAAALQRPYYKNNKNNQQGFFGYCFQTHSGSRKRTLF